MSKWTVVFLAVFISIATNTFALGDEPAIKPTDTTATCDFVTSGTLKFKARWTPSTYTCAAGHYLPMGKTNCTDADTKCLENHYCTGGTYTYNTESDQGIDMCPNNTKAPEGSRYSTDCGYILHVGDDIVYLHESNAKTEKPRLAVKVGTKTYYANMSNASEEKPMTNGSDNKLHIKINDTDYTVHDNSVYYEE